MRKNTRTSIDDLDALGYELPEEHLRLAVGGDLAVDDGGGGGAVEGLKKTLWSRDCTGFIDHHCGDMIWKRT